MTLGWRRAGCAQAYAPGRGIAYVKGNHGGDSREERVSLPELFRRTLLLQLEVRIYAFPEFLRLLLGGRYIRGKHVAKQLPLAAFFSPDDDVLPMVENLAGLIAEFVLTHFGGRRATTEEINGREPNLGNSGIERALPEFSNRLRAFDRLTSGR